MCSTLLRDINFNERENGSENGENPLNDKGD